MVEEIVKEIKAFCRNKDVSVMDLREKFDTCYKLVKIWLTETLVGLFLVSTDTEEIITNKRFDVTEFCGFYSAKKDQLFVEGLFRFILAHTRYSGHSLWRRKMSGSSSWAKTLIMRQARRWALRFPFRIPVRHLLRCETLRKSCWMM